MTAFHHPFDKCLCKRRRAHGLRARQHDPLRRHLALTFASAVLFAIVWLGMLMQVSTAGIVRVTKLESGPLELVDRGLWPVAVAVAFSKRHAASPADAPSGAATTRVAEAVKEKV